MLHNYENEIDMTKQPNSKRGGNLINSPCCDEEIIIHFSKSNFSFIDHFSCKKCGKELRLQPLDVRKNW